MPARNLHQAERVESSTSPVAQTRAGLAVPNKFLAGLPDEAHGALAPHLLGVHYARGRLLDPSQVKVIFPTSGLLSTLVDLHGKWACVALTGSDSFAGPAGLTGSPKGDQCWRALTDVTGFSIGADRFYAIVKRTEPLTRAVGDHLEDLLAESRLEIARRGASGVQARLAGCLLIAAKKLGAFEIPISQEGLADLLGTQRTTICAVAVHLRETGVIAYRRGKLIILREDKLLELSRT